MKKTHKAVSKKSAKQKILGSKAPNTSMECWDEILAEDLAEDGVLVEWSQSRFADGTVDRCYTVTVGLHRPGHDEELLVFDTHEPTEEQATRLGRRVRKLLAPLMRAGGAVAG